MRTNQETRKGRIIKVQSITRVDDSPDASCLGKYSNTPGPDNRTIDREERRDMDRREMRYFIAAMSGEETGNPESVEQDYQRMESLNKGEWYFVGMMAEAQVTLPGSDIVQRITSGGLWGIESDSGDYLDEVRAAQLADLRDELARLGFGKRAIAAAFENVEQVNK